MQPFTRAVIDIIRAIPRGMVTTYGSIAAAAGNQSGARQVARILHSSSDKYDLPWHRVINYRGTISPRLSMSHIEQRRMLEDEGVRIDPDGVIDFHRYLWQPEAPRSRS